MLVLEHPDRGEPIAPRGHVGPVVGARVGQATGGHAGRAQLRDQARDARVFAREPTEGEPRRVVDVEPPRPSGPALEEVGVGDLTALPLVEQRRQPGVLDTVGGAKGDAGDGGGFFERTAEAHEDATEIEGDQRHRGTGHGGVIAGAASGSRAFVRRGRVVSGKRVSPG